MLPKYVTCREVPLSKPQYIVIQYHKMHIVNSEGIAHILTTEAKYGLYVCFFLGCIVDHSFLHELL